MKIRCVIFDMDGTLTDAPYDWKKIRQELDTRGKPILSHISELEEPEKTLKWKIQQKYEFEATVNATLKKGIPEFLNFLKQESIVRALVTNNTQKNVNYLMTKFKLDFDYVLTRESGLWKPSGAPLRKVLKRYKLSQDECCAVGDSEFDIQAALDAGISNIFIINPKRKKFKSNQADMSVSIESIHKKIEHLIRESSLI